MCANPTRVVLLTLDGRALSNQSEGPLLLLFGSTWMNYDTADMARLMRRLCFPGMLISFESSLRSGRRLLCREYESSAVIRFAFGPLSLVGATLEQFDFQLLAAKDRLRFEFIARRSVRLEHPGAPRLRAGDRVRTAISRRPTLSEYRTEASRMADRFDTFVLDNQVVASLGRVKRGSK
jgi:hypothetical protein